MRQLARLAASCALIVALALPSSPLASQEVAPELAPAVPAPSAPAPAQAPEVAQPQGEPASAAPGPPAPAEPGPGQGGPAGEVPAAPGSAGEGPAKAAPRERAGRSAPASAAAGTTVTIVDFAFGPADVTVDQGDTVTWVNEGPTPHSATAVDGNFDTGVYPAGQSRSHTFAQAGSFAYLCTPHPWMRGTVTVRAAQATAPDPAGAPAPADSGSPVPASGGTPPPAAGPTLPQSGSGSGALLLLGCLMLLLGAVVHRGVRSRAARPAARRGW